MTATPKSLIEAVLYYSDLDLCDRKMTAMKWPDGKIACPKCGDRKVGRISSRRMFQCKNVECRKQFSVKVGTIFEDSPLGLDKWFVAVWCIANAKNGISSHELARALGVTQKSAWFMLHRIREAMQARTFEKLEGEIEVDETFVGGESRNMHKHVRAKRIIGRGAVGKKPVQGVLKRGGEVRTFVVRDTEGETLRPIVSQNVSWGSKVFTDALPAYEGLSRLFAHYAIDHTVAFVRGSVHTNGLENFWCLFKRCIKGTWTHVAVFHLERYAREQAWRFNFRRLDDSGRFDRVLSGVVGRRITYRQLCAIDDAGFMGKR